MHTLILETLFFSTFIAAVFQFCPRRQHFSLLIHMLIDMFTGIIALKNTDSSEGFVLNVTHPQIKACGHYSEAV